MTSSRRATFFYTFFATALFGGWEYLDGERDWLTLVTSSLMFLAFTYLMMRLVQNIDWSQPEDALPAFLIIAGIPLTFSIAAGIGFGVLGYVLAMVATGKARAVHPLMWVVAPLFVAFFAEGWLSANVF